MKKVNWDTVLQFNYYLAGVRGRLRLCYSNNISASLTENNNSEGVEIRLVEFLKIDSMNTNSIAFQCPFQISGANMQIDSRQWKTAQVDMPKSSQQVFKTKIS